MAAGSNKPSSSGRKPCHLKWPYYFFMVSWQFCFSLALQVSMFRRCKSKGVWISLCLFSLCKQCGIKFIPNWTLSRQYNFYGFTNTLMSSMSSIFLNRRFECSGTRYCCEIKRVSFVANCLVNCLLLCSTHKVKGCIIFEVQLKTLITALLFCSAHFKSN